MAPTPFPDNFLWGAATSSYQIEGAPLADGAGESIWHRFSHQPGNVKNGDTGDVAADHYHRFEEDVRLMHWMGLKSYRFSVAWGRVLPEGRGAVNQRGLDFYQRLVDTLLEHGIKPMLTLYHWDLPQALEDKGGWLNSDIAGWFADYAEVLFRTLDDRVSLWATLNEPWVVANHGYRIGEHAPGHRTLAEVPVVAHNLLRAHANATKLYRDIGRNQIGIVVNLEPKHPASESEADLAATQREHVYQNLYYLDPPFLGRYPEGLAELFGEAWPGYDDAAAAELRGVPDFVGVNYYTRGVIRDGKDDRFLRSSRVFQEERIHTTMGWEVYAAGLTEVLEMVAKRYDNIPLYVTENGSAFPDPDHAVDGIVADPQREAYLKAHIRAVQTALDNGVDVRGYYAWSLLDNFEWAHGFSQRFGLIHIDYETLERTPKDSARAY
ncbi:MAG TPA: GH1 family beta-glucosidase, partial [Rhodothermales bacterium]